jgi:hypothetical protein
MSRSIAPLALRIRCRRIHTADFDAVADLLARGFRIYDRGFWVRRLNRLAEHPTPEGFPRFGYLMECDTALLGAILQIFSAVPVDGRTRIRCYVTGWYVEPEFRSYAAMFASRILRYKQVTYLNLTPRDYVVPILRAQGYKIYYSKFCVAVPALSLSSHFSHINAAGFNSDIDNSSPTSAEEELIHRHTYYGCISVIYHGTPFVFLPRRRAGVLPYVRLVYCRKFEDFVRLAGPLGRILARRGFPLVVLDTNGPIKGLIGLSAGGCTRYFKGPDQPRLGDLAYSPGVVFGS